MEERKKLFVILSRVPYPLEKGDKLRAYYQVKALSESYEITLCCLSDSIVEENSIKELEKIVSELHVYKLNKVLIYWNLFKMLFSPKPFQVGYFFQNRIKKKVHRTIRRVKPDLIYCQLIRTAEYVKDVYEVPKTIDYMDAFSMGMLRRANISKGFKKYIFNLEGNRLKLYENKIFDYFDHHTIISEQDRKFINHAQNKEIKIVENGIDDSFFSYQFEGTKPFDLVFVGNLNYAPNIACCEFIINELLPQLLSFLPEVKILLSGASPNEKLVSKVKYIPQITLSGWVDDIKSSYVSGKIFIAPLFIGTGLQNKLLEAMALGVPCVTTSLANNALNAEKGSSILIADNIDEFIDNIKLLLNDSDLYDKVSKDAKEFVRTNFDWNKSSLKIPLN